MTVGAVYPIDGQVCGLELFDAGHTWQQLMPKVLRGCGIDARPDDAGAPLAISACDQDLHPACGEYRRRRGATACYLLPK